MVSPMRALPVLAPVNVAAIDERDPNAGNASHLYAIQFGGPKDVLTIQFQHGPRSAEGSRAGVFEDALLAILEDRLEGFQSGSYACSENATALSAVQTARGALGLRVADRMSRSVLGVNAK